MLLKNKNAVIYGGGGAIGGSVALAFAREGAKIFLAGRSKEKLVVVEKEITAAGGVAESTRVDALNQQSVEDHVNMIEKKSGGIDIVFNAIGVTHIQGVPFTELSYEDYDVPIRSYTKTHFLTSTATARYMMKRKRGVILTISTPGSMMANGIAGGFGVACAAIEGLTRQLAGELGAYGIRVTCLRPDAIPETLSKGSHANEVFGHRAKLAGITLQELMAPSGAGTLLQRSPTLDEVANAAVFFASDKASAITANIVNLSCGSVVDNGFKV
jgi:NAD(P)-dependent dehydrogenase (short-subunit alcohol dehydrogenase family)